MASYQKLTLANNLRVVTVQLPDSQTVTVLVLVRTGSKNETKKLNGISHFLEHMLFKGTTKRPSKKEIAEILDNIGASYNAFTSREHTGYYIKAATKYLDLALDVVSDIYLNSTLDPKEIEKERKVILEELKMREDLPMVRVQEALEELLYGDQPAGWLVVGTKETISNIRQENIVDYYHHHYVAPVTVVCLVGPQEHKESLEKIKSYFSEMRNQESPPSPPPTVEKQQKPALLVRMRTTDQTHLNLGFRTFPFEHPDRYTLELLALILGGGMSSRLFQKIREEEGLAYYIHAENNFETDCGYLAIRAGVAHDKVGYALDAILSEVAAVKKGQIEAAELQKVKDQMRGQMALSLESSSDWASFYGEQEILRKKILTPQEILANFDKVTLEDIIRVSQEVFKNERLNVALVGPIGKRLQRGFVKLLKVD